MNQEAILPPRAADCGGSRRSAGSCCTNGCLHNSTSATRKQKSHAPCALSSHSWTTSSLEQGFFICCEIFREGCGQIECWLSIVILCWLFIPPSLSLGFPPRLALPLLSSLPCVLLLPLLLPVTALTVWLHVKAGAFCGSVTNLPGKTETICSGLGWRGDEGVNTWV